MQTATATVAGRRRVSFTLPEPAATTFIARDVESEGRRSTWPPTRTERYPEGLRKAPAPTRSESEPGPTKTCLLDLAFADESRAVDADAYEELRLGDDFFDYIEGHVFCGAATTIFWACNSFQAVSARRRDARYGRGVYACLRRGRPRQTSVYGAPRLQNSL